MGNFSEASSQVARNGSTRRAALLGAAAAVGGVVGGGVVRLTTDEAASLDGYFSVKDYGAVGDDGGDDAGAFQAAIDAAASSTDGGIVYVPPTPAGYRISQIRMKSNVWLTGTGVRSALKSVDENPNAYMIILDGTTVTDTWISGLQLACSKANQTNNGCLLYDQTGESGDRRHRFFDLYVNGFQNDGFHFTGAARAMFLSRIYFGSNDGNGLVFDADATDNSIDFVQVGHSGLAGIVDDGSNNRYVGCKVFHSGQVMTASGVGYQMTGQVAEMGRCEAQSCESHGFLFRNTVKNDARGLISDSCKGDAFRLEACTDSVVMGSAIDAAKTTPKHTAIVNLVGTCFRNKIDVSYVAEALASGSPVRGRLADNEVKVSRFGG